jgi:hypothetical protein
VTPSGQPPHVRSRRSRFYIQADESRRSAWERWLPRPCLERCPLYLTKPKEPAQPRNRWALQRRARIDAGVVRSPGQDSAVRWARAAARAAPVAANHQKRLRAAAAPQALPLLVERSAARPAKRPAAAKPKAHRSASDRRLRTGFGPARSYHLARGDHSQAKHRGRQGQQSHQDDNSAPRSDFKTHTCCSHQFAFSLLNFSLLSFDLLSPILPSFSLFIRPHSCPTKELIRHKLSDRQGTLSFFELIDVESWSI